MMTTKTSEGLADPVVPVVEDFDVELSVTVLRELPGQLKGWREARGMSQREVSMKSGLSLSTVSQMETSADVTMTMASLRKWCVAVGLDASVLLRRAPGPVPSRASAGGSGVEP